MSAGPSFARTEDRNRTARHFLAPHDFLPMTWLPRKRTHRGARFEPVSTVYRVREYDAPFAAHHVSVVRRAVATTVLTWSLSASVVLASQSERPQDEIWLVSTRHIGSVQSESVPDLHAQRYEPDSGWRPAEIEDATRPTAPDQIVVIYVHGNRLSGPAAAAEGRRYYQRLTNGLVDPVSIRFVIWSWPSDPRRRRCGTFGPKPGERN